MSVNMMSPFLLVCHTAEETSYYVVVEHEVMTCELSTFSSALIHLIGTYFIYDIAYPKPLYSLLIFIQHHILNLSDAQKDTPTVVVH